MNLDGLRDIQQTKLKNMFQMNAKIQLEMFYNESGITELKREYENQLSIFKSYMLEPHAQIDISTPSIKMGDLYASDMEEFKLKIEKIVSIVEWYKKANSTLIDLVSEYNSKTLTMNPELISVVESAKHLMRSNTVEGGRRKQDKAEATRDMEAFKKDDIEEV